MPTDGTPVNPRSAFAPLRNIALMEQLILSLQQRSPHLPGMGCFHGPSGFGKTFAASWAAANLRACYVEAGNNWSPKSMMTAILKELGLPVRKSASVDEMKAEAAEELEKSRRPLLIDEADRLVERRLVEQARELHDNSGTPVVLIGEEGLPHKLKPLERVHNRMLKWQPLEPCDLDDARQLARLYCQRIEIDDDLLALLVARVHGSTRRIAVNIERFAEFGHGEGLKRVTCADWGDRAIYTGAPPAVRRFVA